MTLRRLAVPVVLMFALVAVIASVDPAASRNAGAKPRSTQADKLAEKQAHAFLLEGRRIFRHDAFGDQAFWGDTLKLHQAIAGEANGGVGQGLTPTQALQLGLKVDVEALPGKVRSQIKRGAIDVDDPATTL